MWGGGVGNARTGGRGARREENTRRQWRAGGRRGNGAREPKVWRQKCAERHRCKMQCVIGRRRTPRVEKPRRRRRSVWQEAMTRGKRGGRTVATSSEARQSDSASCGWRSGVGMHPRRRRRRGGCRGGCRGSCRGQQAASVCASPSSAAVSAYRRCSRRTAPAIVCAPVVPCSPIHDRVAAALHPAQFDTTRRRSLARFCGGTRESCGARAARPQLRAGRPHWKPLPSLKT